VGTLAAVIAYFRHDVRLALGGIARLIRGKADTPGARLALYMAIATVPVVIAGFVIKMLGLDQMMRSIAVIGWAMLGFGLVLYWADRSGPQHKTQGAWGGKDALVMGLAQALALIPGTSRSGITITAARRLGYDRTASARLSMLMSIPTIAASGTLLGLDVIGQANWTLAKDAAIAAGFACCAALLALSLMMRLLRHVSFTPYVIYRVLLGAVLLVIAYS
jgi:undecaprenyl-diphosphatase